MVFLKRKQNRLKLYKVKKRGGGVSIRQLCKEINLNYFNDINHGVLAANHLRFEEPVSWQECGRASEANMEWEQANVGIDGREGCDVHTSTNCYEPPKLLLKYTLINLISISVSKWSILYHFLFCKRPSFNLLEKYRWKIFTISILIFKTFCKPLEFYL